MDIAIPPTKDALLKLVSNVPSNAARAVSNAINEFERKISGKTAIRTGKGFTLFILTEDIDDSIKMVDSLEKPGLLTDVAVVRVKQNKKQEDGFLGAMMERMAASLIAPMTSLFLQPVASSQVNAITGKDRSYKSRKRARSWLLCHYQCYL